MSDIRPTKAQLGVLRGLVKDPARGHLVYDPPTGIAWQPSPLLEFSETVRNATFLVLLRNGWIEKLPNVCAPFAQVVYGISVSGLETIR